MYRLMYPNDENEATEGDYTPEISLMEVSFKPTVLLIQSVTRNNSVKYLHRFSSEPKCHF